MINCRTDSGCSRSTCQPLSCCVVNACSLKKPNALQLLTTEICSHEVDVAAVTETWLNKNIASSDLTVAGYRLYRCDRLRRKGGGLCIYVRDCLTADVITLPNSNDETYCMHELLYLKIQKFAETYLFLLLYHPPKPKYKPNTLLERLTSDVESLIDTHPTATLYLTGDFNHLNISQFLSETGLQQIVTEATRGTNTLDLFITNRLDQAQCRVAQSSMQTDHRALFINCVVPHPAEQTARSRCKATFYDLRKHHIDALAAAFNECNWSSVLEITDVDLAYERFLCIAETLISLHIPQHTVTIPDNTPRYITPLIKSLLRKRKREMNY